MSQNTLLIVYKQKLDDQQLDFFRLNFKDSERHYISAETLIAGIAGNTKDNNSIDSRLDIQLEHQLNDIYPPQKASNVQRYQQCIAIDNNSTFDLSLWQPALGLVKNLYCERVLVLFRDSDTKNINETLRALGFFNEEDYPVLQSHYRCMSYNLCSYNRKRDWNNARFWANPENFNRFRW